jgi:hypothetical protein
MNRNEGRTGLTDTFVPEPDSPTPATHIDPATNPGFAWATPTEFVKLPSGGRYYPEGHPLHGKDSVEISYMTAKEEDILTSKALIKQGVVIDRLLQSVVVDKTINVNNLLVGDKNAVLVAARITGYGEEYTTNTTCPACFTTDEFTFDLTDGVPVDVEETALRHGVEMNLDGTFTVELPLTKARVECRLLTGADEAKLAKEAERKNRRKIEESTLTDSFRAFIVSVNEDNSPFTIASFVKAMPARDSRHLRTVYADMVPSIDLTQKYECNTCGYSADMEVPLTADFFWPK